MRSVRTGLLFLVAVTVAGMAPAAAQEVTDPAVPDAADKGKVHVMDRVVVTATRLEQTAGEVGESVTVISGEELQQRGAATVQEALRTVAGVNVRASGPLGSATAISIRGSGAPQALVMLDGVPLTDPTLASFDFSDLSVDNIERIEIVRGPQSTLWGSDAMGGIVNIITRTGEGHPTGSVGLELGSFGFDREFLSAQGGNEFIDFSLGVSRVDTENHLDNAEFADKAGSVKIGVNPFESLRLELIVRSTNSHSESPYGFPSAYAPLVKDPNTSRDHDTATVIVNLIHRPTEWWDHRARVSYLDVDSEYNDEPNEVDGDYYHTWNDSRVLNVDWQHNFHIGEIDTVTVGYTFINQKADSRSASRYFGFDSTSMLESDVDAEALYVQNQLRLFDRLFLTAGVRFDDHDVYGSDTNGKVSVAYMIPETGTRLRGSYGSGFRAPQVLEVFDPYMGNPDLKAETSLAFDVGLDQSFYEDRLVFGLTYFRQTYKDLIQYNPLLLLPGRICPGAMDNIGSALIEGVEVSMDAQLTEHLALSAQYTHLRTEDEATGQELLRRPENTGGVSLRYRRGPFTATLSASLVDESAPEGILDFDGEVIEPDAYAKVDLSASWDITKHIQIFGRVENLLDESYAEVQGFPEANPISGYAGVKVIF